MSTLTATKGVLGKKLGMTQVWDDNNNVVPVTVIEVSPNVVTQIRTVDNDGYDAIQIAAGAIDPRKVTKPLKGHFEKAGVTPVATSPKSAPRRLQLRSGPRAHRRSV